MSTNKCSIKINQFWKLGHHIKNLKFMCINNVNFREKIIKLLLFLSSALTLQCVKQGDLIYGSLTTKLSTGYLMKVVYSEGETTRIVADLSIKVIKL